MGKEPVGRKKMKRKAFGIQVEFGKKERDGN